MPQNTPKFVHAVYLPPVTGLPYLAVRLEEKSTDAVPFASPDDAAEYNRKRPVQSGPAVLQTVPALYRRLLREALRELVEAKGEAALDAFVERARLVLTLDVPNISQGQDELNKRAFENVGRDVDRVRANPYPNQIEYDERPGDEPPMRSG